MFHVYEKQKRKKKSAWPTSWQPVGSCNYLQSVAKYDKVKHNHQATFDLSWLQEGCLISTLV